jgi:DeoR/GlpR family transcriptional regulator of sugar metabolism
VHSTSQLLVGSAGIGVIVIGGRLRATSFDTTGPLSVDAIRSLHADVAVISADGITPGGGVRDFSLDDAASARAMSESSASTLVLASPGKIGFEARVRVLDWPEIDTLITARLSAPFAEALAGRGVQVVLVA